MTGIGKFLSHSLGWLVNEPEDRLWLGWWVSFLLVGAAIHLVTVRRSSGHWPTMKDVLRHVFPLEIYRTRSFRHDVALTFLNRAIQSSIFLLPYVLKKPLAPLTLTPLIVRVLGPNAHPREAGLVGTIAATVAAVLVLDLMYFVCHYLFHRVPILWELHKVHHSVDVMNPFTTDRQHPLDVLSMSAFMGVGTLLLAGFGNYVFLHGLPMKGIVYAMAFYNLTANFRHSHIPISLGPLEYVMNTPRLHHVHHSVELRHRDKNFGMLTSLWDRLAGTLYIPARGESFALGIEAGEAAIWNESSLPRMLLSFIPRYRITLPAAPGPAATPVAIATPVEVPRFAGATGGVAGQPASPEI